MSIIPDIDDTTGISIVSYEKYLVDIKSIITIIIIRTPHENNTILHYYIATRSTVSTTHHPLDLSFFPLLSHFSSSY